RRGRVSEQAPMTTAASVIEWGAERARAGPWRGDPVTAYLASVPEAPPPSPSFVRHCVEALADRGYRAVVTAALTPREQRPFLASGFEEHERLHLLAHDLDDLPPAARLPLHRPSRAERPAVLAVDTSAFQPFWRLDQAGLEEALRATPSTRFRSIHD